MTGRPRLGRRIEHDERSRAFPAPTADALRSVTHRHWGPVLDQGDHNSCTGNAITQARNTVPLRAGRPLLGEADALAVYSLATTLDEWPSEAYPPDDTGSSGLAACKAAQRLGWIRAYSHAFGLDAALHALVLSPLVVGIPWYDSMFDPHPDGTVDIAGALAGGHEVCVRRLNVEARWVGVLNSWGPGWGLGGYFRLTFDQLGRLLSEDGDCTVPTN